MYYLVILYHNYHKNARLKLKSQRTPRVSPVFFVGGIMKYIIHACSKRLWYVEGYLIPSMKEQGISDIKIALDDRLEGCLFAIMRNFAECGREKGGAWHLQDDVVISRDFREKTEEYDNGVVCGFWHRYRSDQVFREGKIEVSEMNYSFPCIRIPNEIAGEFAEWFYQDAGQREKYKKWVEAKKYVDSFFMEFMRERYGDGYVYNLKPSIVEHVDWLIGGSTVNKWREEDCRAECFDDPGAIEKLREWLKKQALLF